MLYYFFKITLNSSLELNMASLSLSAFRALWIGFFLHNSQSQNNFFPHFFATTFFVRERSRRQLLHVDVVVLPDVSRGAGRSEVVVDPHLVDREEQGQDVQGRGDPAVPRSFTVRVT